MTRQGLANEADGPRIDRVSGSSVCGAADRILQPAALTELSHKVTARVVNRRRRVGLRPVMQHTTRPEFQLCRQRLVPELQKRPVEMAAGHSQSPLKTGFCFATKAW